MRKILRGCLGWSWRCIGRYMHEAVWISWMWRLAVGKIWYNISQKILLGFKKIEMLEWE